MSLRGSRCLLCIACWVLAGDLFSAPFQRAAELLQRWATTATATQRQQRVRRVQLFVAGEQAAPAPPTSSSTERETAPDGALARAVARGQELLLKGSLDEAAAVLQGVLVSKGDDPGALLHLAEVVAQLGQPRRAVELVDRLLDLELLTPEATSFMLNRRGQYLRSDKDWAAARESYELAVEIAGQGQRINRHALWNLAVLFHSQVSPSETVGPNFSTLERAIELYRVALGRDSTDSNPPGLASGSQENDIGGPVDRCSVLRGLVAALLLAGRAEEAVAELEYALMELTASTDGSDHQWTSSDQFNIENGHQMTSRETPEETPEEATRRTDAALLWDRLSSARGAAGDVPGALAAGKMALSLVGDEPVLHHNMASLLQKNGLFNEAQNAWLAAVALDSSFAPALTGLGLLEGARGDIKQAWKYYEASVAAVRSQGNVNENVVGGHYYVRSGDEELTALFLVATAVVPTLYESNDHIAQVRRDFERGLDGLLAEPTSMSLKGPESLLNTVGSGALGYYIIYQGFEDLEIRRKLAQTYWRFGPSLRYCAPFLANDNSLSWTGGRHHESELHKASKRGSSPLGDLAQQYPLDSLHGDSTSGKVESTLSPEAAQRDLPPPSVAKPTTSTSSPVYSEDLPAGAAHEPGSETSVGNNATKVRCRQRRIKVGFLSAYFFRHSVGLLVEGVVTRLDRRRFETTAIFFQPHPTSVPTASSPGGSVGDDVYNAVRTGTEHVLDVPTNSLAACRQAIASLQLDVLVFTEIGMNLETYFLSFARLARRSVLFWGHAVTSGVTAFDALHPRRGGAPYLAHSIGDGDGRGLAGSGQTREDLGDASPGWAKSGSSYPHEVGGIDYFVSSGLFEDKSLGRHAQRKYGESLYLMEGLTTRFSRPAVPQAALVTRETLGIPCRPLPPRDTRNPSAFSTAANTTEAVAAAAGGGGGDPQIDDAAEQRSLSPSCGALYLVPQTLYKLHPDFDRLVSGVLAADLSGCVVFIEAFEASTTEGLVRRITRKLLAAGVAPERVVFVPRMGGSEFLGLVELADVVLDPFPVGGGRSSFEIFAVGTPVIMLYNRTSILQLTYGMYATMGLEGAIGSIIDSHASVSLVTYSEDQFIRSAVAVATDVDLNARSREFILANNHRLFEQDSVIAEWEGFLEGIVSVPRPLPTERNLGLAVDASDFPRTSPWCSDVGEDSRKMAVDDTAHTSDRSATTGMSANARAREDSATPLASASMEEGAETEVEVGVAAGSVDRNEGSGILARGVPELLYAITFTMAPPREGDEPSYLTAEVYEGMDPMEEADRLRREGALDNLQYRWIGAVLCRGIGRLKRPVVWSTFVEIDGGPKKLLEVRHGDELLQVARWHCHRHSLGVEGIPVLSVRLEKEIPQHADPEWLSARAEDRSCSTPAAQVMPPCSPSSPAIPDHAGDRPISARSENPNSCGGTSTLSAPSRAAALAETSEERHGGDTSARDDGDTGSRHENNGGGDGGGGTGGECVTLAITTCKRLRAFLGTAEGLQALLGPLPQGPAGGVALPRVCQVLVVDDGSSPNDRGVMLSSFPRFTYVFKGPEDVKGHAGSMNIILSMTKTRYLLYVEDDWWAVHDKPLPPRPGVGSFLWRAMEVLTKSTERVSQVLVNDQSTRNCAWGDTAACPPEIQGKSAGWPRFTTGSFDEPDHGQWGDRPSNRTTTHGDRCSSSGVGGRSSCGRNGSPISSFDDAIGAGRPPVKGDSDADVQYRLHEFGLTSPMHAFTHWPGFSLNPALWDLARLDASYRRRYGRQFTFDPTDVRFEQSISVELLDAGVAVAHLPDVTFRHVGGGQSAYQANDMRRPWD